MRRLFSDHRHAFVLGLGLMAAIVVQAREPQSAPPTTTIDVARIGPAVGTTLPDFSLRDQRGVTHSLPSLLGPKGAIIVFFRSADW